ncbi:MAG: hypothetical protein H0V15_01580 [Solirubrobacterales bacterium]|nr:hypothetical protein [Solirubrobacterales bacterium]
MSVPQPSQAQLAAAGLDRLPLAPESKRLDLELPPLSNPTEITNPLFPISELESVVFSGKVDDKPFHTETTLLPETRVIEWAPGRQVETQVSQYFAYLDGRIEEVARDYYAQADDGSVWYFGEEVFDYNELGLVDSTEGSWLAGKHGPPEMIMPADPQVGDVHRAENIPAIAFEELTIKRTEQTMPGPSGPVEGIMVASELHDDGTTSEKVFAPGYGEFFSAHQGDTEAMALAVPTDAAAGPEPAELEAMSAASGTVIDAVGAASWEEAAAGAAELNRTWTTYRQSDLPPRIAGELGRGLEALGPALEARDQAKAGTAAIDVAQSTLDLRLRYQPQAEVDLARFELWARQILVDAAAKDQGGVNGDVATLKWIRDRFADTLEPVELTSVDVHLGNLGESVIDRDIEAAKEEAAGLLDTLSRAGAPPPRS